MLEHLTLGRERFPDLKATRWGKYSITKLTRRIWAQRREHDRALRRIQKLLDRQYLRWLHDSVRKTLADNKQMRSQPHLRLREKDNTSYLTTVLNPWTQYGKITPGGFVMTSEVMQQLNSAEKIGEQRWFLDYSPRLLNVPPVNYCRAAYNRVGSLSASILVPWVSTSQPQFVLKTCRWPVMGLRDAGQDGGILDSGIAWSDSAAEAALLKAYADFYANDLNLNEYIVEWSQVINLLKDPYRTSLRFMHLMDRWTRRNSWIWVPSHVVRTMTNGDVLVSKQPLGAALMSMRSKRLIRPDEVAMPVLNDAANRWLQYRYGIAPLMDDIQTVINLATVARPKSSSKTGNGRHKIQAKTDRSEMTLRRGPLNLTFKRVRSYGQFYSACVFGRIVGKEPSTFRYGLHSSQWLRCFWNGIPYSFVVDWAVNIDTWLTSQINVPWLQVDGNCVTAKRYDRLVSTCVKVVEVYAKRLGVITGAPVASRKIETIERRVGLDRPTLPVLGGAWSKLKNLLTGEALIWSKITSDIAKEERDRKRRK